MREWWTLSCHLEEPSLAWGRRRGERPANTGNNLVALPILLLVLGIPSQQREGYLWLCAAGTVSEYLQENATGGGSELERYGPLGHPLAERFLLPRFTGNDASNKVPLRQDSDYNNNMHDLLSGTTTGQGVGDTSFSWRKTRRKHARHRRDVVDLDAADFTPTDWTLQSTTPTGQGEFPPSSGRTFTPVPDHASTASAGSDSDTSYARTSSYPQLTPIVQGVGPTTGSFLNRLISAPTPSRSDTHPLPTTLALQISPTSTQPHGSTLPHQAQPNSRPTTPQESTAGTTLSTPHESQTANVEGGISSFTQAETETITQGDLAAETRQTSPASRSPFTGAIFNSSAEWTSQASVNLTGSSSANDDGKSSRQSSVYSIITNIHTEPSILIIMPCMVGLALLGLVGAGVKRCIVHWRLAHMVELTQDPEKLKHDKGYTIENPMVKSRRSYIERQMEKTLQRVNKTDSSNHNSRSSSNSSRNTNNNKDTKVRMEIATISDGSLRRPVRPLRRSASERVAPSHRRWSSVGYVRSASSQSGCPCCCHCPLCGTKGRPLRNGSVPVEDETVTTRL